MRPDEKNSRNLYIWWQWSTEGRTKIDIARYHGISDERVSQIITKLELRRMYSPKTFLEQVANAI